MITPFSGLSLIIHLLIIGIAEIMKLIYFRINKIITPPALLQRVGEALWLKYKKVALPSISLLTIALVMIVVGTSTVISLRTGIREGRRETHMEYINKKYVAFQSLERKIIAFSEPVKTAEAQNGSTLGALYGESDDLVSDGDYPYFKFDIYKQ